MARLDPHQMTPEDVNAEIEFWEEFFEECKQIGQGISTKESVRYRKLLVQQFVNTLNVEHV